MHGFSLRPAIHRPLMAGIVAAALALPTCAGAQVGGTLEQLRQTDFWRFFHFSQVDSVRHDGAREMVSYRPGGQFRDRVLLDVIYDEQGRMYKLELDLARPFVNDPVNTVFARDIAKSFIRTAMPAADLPAVETLANEIEFPRSLPGVRQQRLRPPPALPEQPSPLYRVFLGLDAIGSLTLSGSRFSIIAAPDPEGNDDLRIAVFNGREPLAR
jgi:hypothetical protein